MLGTSAGLPVLLDLVLDVRLQGIQAFACILQNPIRTIGSLYAGCHIPWLDGAHTPVRQGWSGGQVIIQSMLISSGRFLLNPRNTQQTF